ncbi:MAG TPA: LysR substrate-binding domain-containing protein [Opitutaceae bacterium]|jgi:DNA-binding transcriptional LysR family regulator|nr:LysR substrate-binding domain-containing protein [Opitutaceae bacterium]
MELRHLRYFSAVAAHGSFQRAANNLHVTPPALSRQVKDLEDELGMRLFERGKNLIKLTPAGELFYEEAREVLARADQAVQRVRGQVKDEVLRVGYVPSLTASLMPRAIERFQAATPRVRLELNDLAPKQMTERATAGQLDLVIAPAGIEGAASGFQWTELLQLMPVLVLSPKHPLAKLKKIPPARLRDLPLFGLSRIYFPEYGPRLRAILKPFGISPKLADQTAEGISPLFAALEANRAAAVLTEGIVSMLPRSLEARPFSPALSAIMIMAGMPSIRPNPRAEVFLRLLREGVYNNKIRA